MFFERSKQVADRRNGNRQTFEIGFRGETPHNIRLKELFKLHFINIHDSCDFSLALLLPLFASAFVAGRE